MRRPGAEDFWTANAVQPLVSLLTYRTERPLFSGKMLVEKSLCPPVVHRNLKFPQRELLTSQPFGNSADNMKKNRPFKITAGPVEHFSNFRCLSGRMAVTSENTEATPCSQGKKNVLESVGSCGAGCWNFWKFRSGSKIDSAPAGPATTTQLHARLPFPV